MGLTVSLPKRYVPVLLNMHLLENRIFIEVIKLIWGHCGGPKKKFGHSDRHTVGRKREDTQREGGHVAEVIRVPAKGSLTLRERREQFLPWAFRASVVLPTPWFWTSVLQKCEMINFYCLKPLGLWCFVLATPEKTTHSHWILTTLTTIIITHLSSFPRNLSDMKTNPPKCPVFPFWVG